MFPPKRFETSLNDGVGARRFGCVQILLGKSLAHIILSVWVGMKRCSSTNDINTVLIVQIYARSLKSAQLVGARIRYVVYVCMYSGHI